MTQPFEVVSSQTGKIGKKVKLETTVSDMEDIISGKHDGKKPDELLYIGEIENWKIKMKNNKNNIKVQKSKIKINVAANNLVF